VPENCRSVAAGRTVVSKSIGLTVPAREKPRKENFDIRARKLEAWVAALPMANLGETARRVYGVLVETNGLDYPWAERSRFLETMLQPVAYVTNGMRRHFVGAQFPLPEKSRRVATVTSKLYAEMATAYAIAAEDLLAHNLIFPDSRQLALLMHRTLSMLGRVMLTGYQTYSPCRDGLWREIYRLYGYARKRRLHNVAVSDALRDQVRKSTIEDEFKRLLLMALSSPYCLRHGEINKIYLSLERWADRARLLPLSSGAIEEGGFLACLDEDRPPRHIANGNLPAGPGNCHVLDTRRLTEVVRDEIQRADKVVASTLTGIDMQRTDMSHALLRRLLLTWTHTPHRVFSRSHRQSNVQLVMGLSATHQIIAGAGKQPGTSSTPDRYFQPATFSDKDADQAPPPDKSTDVWDMIYATGASDSTLAVLAPGESAPVSAAPPEETASRAPAVAYWNIVNESAGGYCLESSEDIPASIQVGELVGVRRNGDGHTWKWGIGVVRWMRSGGLDSTHSTGIKLGIEMLTPDAAAAGVRVAGEAEGDYQRTLMLPALPAINKPATLITPPVPFREGGKVTVRILGKQMQVQLTRQLENTGHFAQFQFEILDTMRTDAGDAGAAAAGDETDYASIWSSI